MITQVWKENTTTNTIPSITAWVARDYDGGLYLYLNRPQETMNGYHCLHDLFRKIDRDFFPELKYGDDPIEVEMPLIAIKRY